MNTLIAIIILGALFILIYGTVRHRLRQRRLLRHGMFEKITPRQLDNFHKLAIKYEFESLFLNWMRFIRQQHGHENIRVGHAIWAIQKCYEKQPPIEGIEVPKFDNPEHTRIIYKPTD